MKCKNCKYFRDFGNGTGECRFNAPIVRKEVRPDENSRLQDVTHTQWAIVSDYDYCGQFWIKDA